MKVDFFFFKQKTAYEMRIRDWSSDVCSSDLALVEKMNSSRRFAEAFGTMTQLGYANASLAFYSGVPEGRDLAQVYDAAYGRYAAVPRSEERRVGTEWVSTYRSRWSPSE